MKKGIPVVISAPSGAGKTTLVKALRRRNKKLGYSISATTRLKRKDERNGKDYFFLSEKEFKRKIKQKQFLEWAKVFDCYYGTPKAFINKKLRKGQDVILEVDVQGALELKKTLKEAIFIFILPPSMTELKRRLKKRGTDSKKEIEKRFKKAKKEIAHLKHYDYFVVSRKVGESVKQIESIIKIEKQKVKRNKEVLNVLHLT